MMNPCAVQSAILRAVQAITLNQKEIDRSRHCVGNPLAPLPRRVKISPIRGRSAHAVERNPVSSALETDARMEVGKTVTDPCAPDGKPVGCVEGQEPDPRHTVSVNVGPDVQLMRGAQEW